jgi:hypothetical protein
MLLLSALLGISGTALSCAAIERSEARSTEDLLAAAGFRQLPADTPQRIDVLSSMKPRTLTTVVRDGSLHFVYPDPTNCNCLYVGTQSNYDEYKRLALQQEIADEQVMAAEDEQDAAYWGPWGAW